MASGYSPVSGIPENHYIPYTREITEDDLKSADIKYLYDPINFGENFIPVHVREVTEYVQGSSGHLYLSNGGLSAYLSYLRRLPQDPVVNQPYLYTGINAESRATKGIGSYNYYITYIPSAQDKSAPGDSTASTNLILIPFLIKGTINGEEFSGNDSKSLVFAAASKLGSFEDIMSITQNFDRWSAQSLGYIPWKYGTYNLDPERFPSYITPSPILMSMLYNVKILDKPQIPGPYDPAGPSTSGGGDGSFDNKSDPVDFTELPSLSVLNSGFVGLFKPSLSQLNELANYLWNEDVDINQLRKLVANPLDLLISLTIMPVDPPTAGSEEIKVGFWNTHISINKIENQYMAIDFGSLEVKEYYGNALDYSPYTKISIYLPYIGLKQLNTDDVMKKTLALRYNVDLFTGACVAEIKAGESVLYTFTGNIANQIPLNAESFNSFLSGLIQAAASVGVAIASHGTSVATQGAAEAGEATAMAARGAQTASNLASMNAALTSAGAVATSKPDILHSGSMTANNGYLSGKTPYLIYEVPRACIPENYQTFVGYPSNITKTLSEVTGFTVVDSVHLENIPATDRELAEIERLLKGGVIL